MVGSLVADVQDRVHLRIPNLSLENRRLSMGLADLHM